MTFWGISGSTRPMAGRPKDAILQVDIGEYSADSPQLVLCSKRCLAYQLAKGQGGSDTHTVSLCFIAVLLHGLTLDAYFLSSLTSLAYGVSQFQSV